MPVLVASKFEEDLIENEHHFLSTTQGHVTLKWLIRSGCNSNLSETLCLSSLPVSLMAIEFRVTEKRWIHHFLQYKSVEKKNQHSRANNSKVNNPIRPDIELIPSFYAYPRYLQIWQISHQKWLRKVKRHHFFSPLKGINSKVTGQIRPEFEPVHLSCLSLLPVSLMKIEFIVTEKKWRHHFLYYKSNWIYGKKFPCSRVNNSEVNNLIRPVFELVQAFMSVLFTCKFDKDPIKGDWEKLETSVFSPLKGT